MPRFMVFVPANEESEAGVLPPDEALDAMTAYNEELVKAGIMLDGAGLHPTSKGAKVRFSNGKVSVIDGPFTEAKELVAGYWLLEAKSQDEVIEWMKRAPFRQFTEQGGEIDLQIRQLYDLEDFGDSAAVDRARQLERKLGQKR
jgi:hypothetical protein